MSYDWFDANSTSKHSEANTMTSRRAPSASSRETESSKTVPSSGIGKYSRHVPPGTASYRTMPPTVDTAFPQLALPPTSHVADSGSGTQPRHYDLRNRSTGQRKRQDGYLEPQDPMSSKSSKYASSSHTTNRGAVTKPKHYGLGRKFKEHRKKEENYQRRDHRDGSLPYTDYWDSQPTRGLGEYGEINVTSFTYHTESHSTSHSRSQFKHIPKQTQKRPFSNLFR